MSPRRKARWLLVSLVCVGLVSYWIFLSASRQVVHLPGAGPLKLAGVTYGTNQFIHGTILQKLVFGKKRSTGTDQFKLGLFSLSRPLTIAFRPPPRIEPVAPRETLNLFFEADKTTTAALLNPDYRILAVSADGETFESHPRSVTGLPLLGIILSSYPRAQKHFTVQLLNRTAPSTQSGPPSWIPVAELRIKNPHPQPPQAWEGRRFPIIRQLSDLRVIFGECVVEDASTSPANPPFNVVLRFQFIDKAGAPVLCRFVGDNDALMDAYGNCTEVFGAPALEEGWTVFRAKYSLGTNQIWRLKGAILRQANWPHSPEKAEPVEYYFLPQHKPSTDQLH